MQKALIIGIDGGTWTVLRPAIERGYMPFLQNLVENGASGVLESTIPAITPAAWGSFQTGMNPGENGVFDFYRWDKELKTHQLVSSQHLSMTIWDIAGRNGKKVGVLNVPMTYPPKPVNGYMVTGALTPSIKSNFTYPASLASELLQAVPRYRIINVEDTAQDPPHKLFEPYVRLMADATRYRADAAEFILQKEPLDVFMVHFMAPDILQHRLWCYLDDTNPKYDAQKHEYILQHFYQPLDQAMQKAHQAFTRTAHNNFTTFTMSDHGFESHHKIFNLGLWCNQQGYLKLSPRASKTPLTKKIIKALRIGKLLGLFLSQKTVTNMERSLRLDIGRYDWNHSTVFCLGVSGEAFIYLLEGKKENKENTSDQIIRKLSTINDPQTGKAVIERIYHKKELYHGRCFDEMPDLVVVPAEGCSITTHFEEHSELFHPVNIEKDVHIGKHHPDGILVAAGASVAPQKNIRARILDMTPTILYCLGLPLREDFDGNIIEPLFTADFRRQSPTAKVKLESARSESGNEKVYSENDEQEIRKRLENMGYL
jgi:predicted AlkP superfamily phosphohydrolase/phosphomutase